MAEIPFADEAYVLSDIAQSTVEFDPNLGQRMEAFRVALGGLSGLYEIADRPGDPVTASKAHNLTLRYLENGWNDDLESDLLSDYAAQIADLPDNKQEFVMWLHQELRDTITTRRQDVDTAAGLVSMMIYEGEIITNILSINGRVGDEFESQVEKRVSVGRLMGPALHLQEYRQNEQTLVSPTVPNTLYVARFVIDGLADLQTVKDRELVAAARDLTPRSATVS